VGDVDLYTGHTVYERFGDLPVLLGAAALLIGGWVAALTEADSSDTARRQRRNGAPTRLEPHSVAQPLTRAGRR